MKNKIKKWVPAIILTVLQIISIIGIIITKSPYWLAPCIIGYTVGICSAIIVAILVKKKDKKK